MEEGGGALLTHAAPWIASACVPASCIGMTARGLSPGPQNFNSPCWQTGHRHVTAAQTLGGYYLKYFT